MTSLTNFAHITAHPDKVDLVKAELEKPVPVTRAEPGCLPEMECRHVVQTRGDGCSLGQPV